MEFSLKLGPPDPSSSRAVCAPSTSNPQQLLWMYKEKPKDKEGNKAKEQRDWPGLLRFPVTALKDTRSAQFFSIWLSSWKGQENIVDNEIGISKAGYNLSRIWTVWNTVPSFRTKCAPSNVCGSALWLVGMALCMVGGLMQMKHMQGSCLQATLCCPSTVAAGYTLPCSWDYWDCKCYC